jgi:hypothetical protein
MTMSKDEVLDALDAMIASFNAQTQKRPPPRRRTPKGKTEGEAALIPFGRFGRWAFPKTGHLYGLPNGRFRPHTSGESLARRILLYKNAQRPKRPKLP